MRYTRYSINLVLATACVVSGSVICWWLVRTKPVPSRHGEFVRLLEVEALPVEPTEESVPVIGYGTVRARHQVKIVPQVSGQLIRIHDNLAVGKSIPKGELLFEIDPSVYEARLRQAEAEVKGLEASVQRHEQELTSLETRIANMEEMLAIDEKDYLTSKRLYEVEKVGTERDVDLLYQKYLRQKDALIELETRRSLLPHLKRETQARLEAARARLKQARHDLESTKIFCPFDARVDSVTAYRSQVVTAHFSIATLTDMAAFELPVGIAPRDLRWLEESIRPAALTKGGEVAGPAVTVRWSLHGQEFIWRGFVTRFERVDEATRTVRLVVEVRKGDMLADADEGLDESGQMLAIGMRCRVELPARALSGALVVPRHAIVDNRWVYVFEPDPSSGAEGVGRLGRREVPILRTIGDSVLVDYAEREGSEVCELAPGERVVVSPLIKPVVGMQVRLRNERRVRDDAPTTASGQRALARAVPRAADPLHLGPKPREDDFKGRIARPPAYYSSLEFPCSSKAEPTRGGG